MEAVHSSYFELVAIQGMLVRSLVARIPITIQTIETERKWTQTICSTAGTSSDMAELSVRLNTVFERLNHEHSLNQPRFAIPYGVVGQRALVERESVGN